MIDIKIATTADLDEMMSVMRAAFDPLYGESWNVAQCEGMMSLPGTTVWLAYRQNEVAGFAMSRVIAAEAELLLLAVKPGYRGQGIGRKLLNSVKEDAKEKAAAILHLEVREGNEAIHLYLSVGFVQVGSRPRYYRGIDGQSYNAATYHLSLI